MRVPGYSALERKCISCISMISDFGSSLSRLVQNLRVKGDKLCWSGEQLALLQSLFLANVEERAVVLFV